MQRLGAVAEHHPQWIGKGARANPDDGAEPPVQSFNVETAGLVETSAGHVPVSAAEPDSHEGFLDKLRGVPSLLGTPHREVHPFAASGTEHDDVDLATGGRRWSDGVSVLLNNGDATFQAAVFYQVGDFPTFCTMLSMKCFLGIWRLTLGSE